MAQNLLFEGGQSRDADRDEAGVRAEEGERLMKKEMPLIYGKNTVWRVGKTGW